MKKYHQQLTAIFFILVVVEIFLLLLYFFPDFFFLKAGKSQQFSELANSFLHGKTYFLDDSVFNALRTDNTPFGTRFYWPLGPFPAVLLMPFVLISPSFLQGYLSFFLVAAIFYFIFVIARTLKYSLKDSLILSFAFVFSSMFIGVAIITSSWYFAHTVSVFLMFLALLEYFKKRRPLVIGLLFGLILLTRLTAFLGIIFFALDILLEKTEIKEKITKLIKLCIFPLICLIILFSYNYVRFGNIFDQGYKNQILQTGFMADKRDYGLWNLKYLPRGLRYSLINGPLPDEPSDTKVFNNFKPDGWGMSIFLTSPFLLYLFFVRIKDRKIIFLIGNSVFILAMILPTFFIGHSQFGFRYALDFMPLLFTAFMMAYQQDRGSLSLGMKLTIIISAVFNFYLLCQML